jgi:hypothetical protein
VTDESDILNALSTNQERYTPKDKYHDFRKLFTSDEGKRVLREIVSWGRILKAPVLTNPVDPYLLAIQEGERNIVRRLLVTINNEPVEPPAHTEHAKVKRRK